MPKPRVSAITPDDLLPHWRKIAGEIGERRAGSDAEHATAQYIQSQFASAGLKPWMEAFQCNSLRHANATLEVLDEARWVKAPIEVLVGSPSTSPADRPREYELVWVEMPEQSARLTPGSMKGKALGLFGPLATSTENHRRIVQSGASLVIWIDDRIPADWPKSDAILPAWARRVGALPTIAAAYKDAYMWRVRGVKRIRACVETRHFAATSYNVIADVEGRDPKAGVIAFGCHYDTQCGNVGADDNGSGTVAIIALAKKFAEAARAKPFLRTLRFIAFGTEEQLSVGSKAYVETHRSELDPAKARNSRLPGGHALMLNLDSCSSALGHTEMYVSGSKQLEGWGVREMARYGIGTRVVRAVTPFADHFPFTMFGVPALWFYRP
ncbi:MAG TPA: M28 family peptidase, partial [Planctomycetota bacterium]|nr:M28 family peptidase [Planctomycetota bacterium]